MKRSKQLEKVFLGALQQTLENGREEIATSILITRAEELATEQPENFPVKPPLSHRFGNMMLRLARRRERPYTPVFSELTIMPVVNRLYADGTVNMREDPLSASDNTIILLSLMCEESHKVES